MLTPRVLQIDLGGTGRDATLLEAHAVGRIILQSQSRTPRTQHEERGESDEDTDQSEHRATCSRDDVGRTIGTSCTTRRESQSTP